MGILRNLFKRSSVPPNYLSRQDVQFILGIHTNAGEPATAQYADAQGNVARYVAHESAEGVFTLEMSIPYNGQEYRTNLRAEKIDQGRTYAVKSLVFDNASERLDNPHEIYRVLNYIGNQVRWISRQHMPTPHENKGELSRLGRFMIRHFSSAPKGGF